jgi:hypothetical protein
VGVGLDFYPVLPPLILAPISVDVDPATTARDPSAGDPDCARPGWRRPATSNPDIPSSGPAVISGYPYPTRMQGPSRTFNNHWWRGPDANNYLRVCCTHAQRDSAYRGEQTLLERHQNLRECQLATTAYTKSPLRGDGLVCKATGQNSRRQSMSEQSYKWLPRELCACPRLGERQAKAYDQLTDVMVAHPEVGPYETSIIVTHSLPGVAAGCVRSGDEASGRG